MNTISLKQNLAAALNSVDASKILIEQPYEFKSIFLNRVQPDETNPRFFPAVIMSDMHAFQMIERKLTKQQLQAIYNVQDQVLIGKGCIVNCFKRGSLEWKKVNQSIESITELAANISISEIIQVPTVYPIGNGSYQILTGHRRFFALIFANGENSAAQFKVYDNCPPLPKTKQFQENASREDLPQYGKLKAFEDAILEIEELNAARKRGGGKALTVRETASTLGISMGAYDNYNVLTRYPAVAEFYADGGVKPFIQVKKLVLSNESAYKRRFDKKTLDGNDKKSINERIKKRLAGEVQKYQPSTAPVMNFKINKLNSVDALRKLLTTDVTQIKSDIDWETLDWNNKKDVESCLIKLVELLNEN
ncbi:hypothetical protein A7985_23335 [Pseudoalteromonas luteoviolacea]|uniref:ParB/Sulfiredoxin domain-containing protein n=1 Tax=Pseudoalteromonas luteoviolacea TaxID=43657 RepID=A0A1C0TJN1_9GAMM|nr:ParB/Srx family N-terminal domain-containing protein [Pseudoalteromonas luteoviolacea]MBQ4814048.1 hypothetical protein [Pseudoalteromonas luteoviolacea]OCQ18705.1 hypothetical protein A7985_23335 [Pseudoalteromonas luteoviolacea]